MPWVGDRKIVEKTVEDAAKTYVDVLDSKANAWGRNVHPAYGDSANVRYLMGAAFGEAAFNKAVDEELAERQKNKTEMMEEAILPNM